MAHPLNKLLQPLHRRVMLMLSRARLNITDDASGLQRAQVSALDGEVRDDVERFQQFGLSAHPPAGAEVLMASLGGSRDHPVIFAVDDRRHRPAGLMAGETVLYNLAGVEIRLLEDNSVLIKSSLKVRIETDRLEVTGEIIDHCDDGGRSMRESREIYNGHHHPETNGVRTLTPEETM